MKFIRYWLPTIAFMGLIFFLSSRMRVKVSDVFEIQFLIFKSLHVIEYAVLYVLAYRSLKNTNPAPVWQNRYNALFITVFYAVSDEMHQVFVPSREGRFRDIVIDSIGASTAAIYLWKLLPLAPKRLKNLAKKLEIL